MKKETIQLYDSIVGASLINIMEITKDKEDIVILNFNIKDKKYHYILDICHKVNLLYFDNSKKIKVHLGFFSYLKLKFIKRKSKIYLAKNADLSRGFSTRFICNFMANAFEVDHDIFTTIYEKYYE